MLKPDRAVLQLSLAEAIQLTLSKSLGPQIREVERASALVGVEASKAPFDPVFKSSLAASGSQRGATSLFDTDSGKVTSKNVTLETALSQALNIGGSYSIALKTQRADTNSTFNLLPTSYSSSLVASINYPLLQDRGNQSLKNPLRKAKINVTLADLNLEQEVIDAVSRTQNDYLSLILARENLNVRMESLNLAKNLLEIARAQERVGTLAPIEVLSAESAVAAREEGVILGESAVLAAEDVLRASLNLPENLSMWDIGIIPTDQPTRLEQTYDFDAVVAKAFERRTDYLQTQKNIEAQRLDLELARDKLRPDVGLSSSFGFIGNSQTGATLQPDGTLGAGAQGGIFGSHVEDLLSMSNFQWSLGVSVSQFLGNRSAQGGYRAGKLGLERSLLQLRSLELSIVSQLRTYLRNIETAKKRLGAATVSTELARRRLEAEQKKFEVGTATSFDVLQFQEEYVTAETSQHQALIDLNRSVLQLQQAMGMTLEVNGIQIQNGQAILAPPN